MPSIRAAADPEYLGTLDVSCRKPRHQDFQLRREGKVWGCLNPLLSNGIRGVVIALRMGSVAEHQPQSILGDSIRNFMQFQECLSAFWDTLYKVKKPKMSNVYSLTGVCKSKVACLFWQPIH